MYKFVVRENFRWISESRGILPAFHNDSPCWVGSMSAAAYFVPVSTILATSDRNAEAVQNVFP